MKEKIQAILEREIDKLNAMSLATPEPLAPTDVRSLDTLIKAFRAFVAPTQDPQAGPDNSGPAPSLLPTEQLLKNLDVSSQ